MTTFYTPTKYNGDTKQQMWMSMISDGHDMHCQCEQPFAHLLDIIFPEGHRDRDLTIRQIITRDKKCLSGGTEEEDHGMAIGESAATLTKREEQDIEEKEDDLDALLIAAAADAEDTR